jgi:G3E family GTPase
LKDFRANLSPEQWKEWLKFARKEKKRLGSPVKSKNSGAEGGTVATEIQPSLRRLSLRLENKTDSEQKAQPLRRLSMKLEERMENNKTKPITLSKTEELKEFIRRESIKAGSVLPIVEENEKINPLNTPTTAEVDFATPTIPKEELTSIIRRESIRLLTQSNSSNSVYSNSMKEEDKNETASLSSSNSAGGRSLPKLKTRSSILLSGAKLNMKINTEEIPLSFNLDNRETTTATTSFKPQKEDRINEEDVKHMESLMNRFSSNQVRKKSILHTSYHQPAQQPSIIPQNDHQAQHHEEQEQTRQFPVLTSLKGIFEQNELFETLQPQSSKHKEEEERKEDFSSFITQERRRPSFESHTHHSTQPNQAEHVPDISFTNSFPIASSSRRSFTVHDEGVSIELAVGPPAAAPITKAPSASTEPEHHHLNVTKKPIISVNHPEIRSGHPAFHVHVPSDSQREVPPSFDNNTRKEELFEERKETSSTPFNSSFSGSVVDTGSGVSCTKNMLSRASKPPRAAAQQPATTQPTMTEQQGSNYSIEHHPTLPTNFQPSFFQASQPNSSSLHTDFNMSSSQKPFHRSTTPSVSMLAPTSQQHPAYPISHYSTTQPQQTTPFNSTLAPLPVSDEELILISKKDLDSIKEQLLKTEEKLTNRRQQQITDDSNMFPYYPFEGHQSTRKDEKEPENDQQTSVTSISTQQELKEKLYENLTNANISSVRLSSATSAAKYLIKSLNHFQTTGNLHPYESDG